MTKRCPACRTEVPEDARACPNCPESFPEESESGDMAPTVGMTWSILPVLFFIVVVVLVAVLWFVLARKI